MLTFPIKNDTPQGKMCIYFCMHPYECKHYPLCIMQLTYCILYIAFCMSKFINNISWLFPSKMTPHKAQCDFFFYASICVHTLCIMQLTYCIMYIAFCMSKFLNNIGWLFPSKMTPHKAQCVFVFVCIHECMHYALCIMQLTYRIMHE